MEHAAGKTYADLNDKKQLLQLTGTGKAHWDEKVQIVELDSKGEK